MKKTARLRKVVAYTASFSLVATNFLGVLAPTISPFKVEKVSANGNGLVVTKFVDKTDVWRDIPEDRLVEYEIRVENTAACADAPLDVMLVMDRSGSMDDDTIWHDGYCVGHPGFDAYWCNFFGWTWVPGYWGEPQPLTDAKNSAKGFVDLLDDTKDYTGLVSYSTAATLEQGLTSNHDTVKTAIDGMIAGGSTNIGAAIDVAHNEIATNGRPGSPNYAVPVMILMTDGLANVGAPDGETYAEIQADEAKAAGIRIITIGLGDDANGNWLRDEIATSPSDYYYAPDSSDLNSIYASIQATLGDSIETVLTDDISDILVDADLWSVGEGGVFDGVDTITWNLGTLSCNLADRIILNGGPIDTATVHFSVVVHDDAPDGDVMDNMAVATNLRGSYSESNIVHTNIHALDKWDDVDPVVPGDVFTYTIETMTGDYAVNNVYVVDYLDSNVFFISASHGGIYNSVGHTVEWNLGPTPAHTYIPITVDVQLENPWVDDNADNLLYNEASIQLQYESPMQLPYITSFPEYGFIWVHEYTGVESYVTLSILKSDDLDPVEAGGLLVYEIVYENIGNAAAENVVITDNYDPSTTFVSATPSPDVGFDNQWTVGDLLPGASYSIFVTVEVDSPMNDGYILTNYARVDFHDPTLENGGDYVEDYEYTEVNSAPVLTIVKSDTPDPVIAGQQVSYTLTFENVGNMILSDTEIIDTLPSGFSYVAGSSKIDGVGVSDPTGANPYTWNLATLIGDGELSIDGPHTLTFDIVSSVTLANGVVKTNTAEVKGTYLDQSEVIQTVSSNDTENTTVVAPVLTISKTNNAPTAGVNPNAVVTFTVVVTNVGGATANGVIITDTLPAGVTLVSGTSLIDGVAVGDPMGTNPYTWLVGSLPVGGTATLEYDVIVDTTALAGAYSNSSFADANDIDPTDIVTSAFSVVIPSVLGEETKKEEEGDVLGATGGLAIAGLVLGGMMLIGSGVVLRRKLKQSG